MAGSPRAGCDGGKALQRRAQIALRIDEKIGGCHDFLAGFDALGHLAPNRRLARRGEPCAARTGLRRDR